MAIRKITPYLNFDGTARSAIALYEKALGAKLENAMTFADAPVGQDLCAANPENAKRVMHACLKVGDHQIMLSDGPIGQSGSTDSNAHVMLDFETVAELTTAFDALSAGGSVTFPVHD